MSKYIEFSNYAHRLAISTWMHLTDAGVHGLPFNEETITEWLTLCLARDFQSSFLDVTAFNKWQEGGATNPKPTGADWEVWIETPNGTGITLRFQAKRIFQSGKYEGLDAGKPQYLNLLKNAGAAIPLYLLYNRRATNAVSFPNRPSYCHLSSTEDIFGVSAVRAQEVLGLKQPTPSQIPNMVPWGCLFCDCWQRFTATTLAELVGGRMRAYFERIEVESAAMAQIQFSPGDDKPQWVEGFEDRRGDLSSMILQLEELGLDVVIKIRQTEYWDSTRG
jgi:hypothetical protein